MRFCVLGPLEAYADGRSVAVGGGRQRALLALLLVHAGEVVSRDRLIEELWAGKPPPGGSQSLDAYISRLRRAFREAGAGDVLATRAPGYVLHAGETDARRFEALAAQGREALAAGEAARAAQLLAEALALWRGTAYAEVADESWASAEAGRLAELRLSATEDWIEAELSLGRHAALVPELEVLVAREPTRERLAGQLMLALYRSGRQADALAAYRAVRRSLVEELGLEPGPDLRRLEAAVLAHDPALDLPAKPALDPPPRPGLQPAALVPGPRRHWPRPVFAAGAVLLAAAVTAALALAGGGPSSPRVIAADSVGSLDLATGQVAASVPVGSEPAGIAAGAGSIWVTNGAEGTVSRIDPRGPHVEQTLVVGSSPAGVAYGAGAVWVANALDGSISRIDPRANRVVQTISIGGRPIALATGAGAVWVADAGGDAIVPLDPRSGVPRRPVRLADSPGGVAAGFGALWVTQPLAHKLVRIDPVSGQILAEIGVGAGAGPVAAGGGAVWVVNALDGNLSRIDPARNAVASTVPVGDAPGAVAADAGGVWVTDQGTGELVSVDPQTGTVRRRYTIGAAPAAVALLGQTPWVAAGAPAGREHRGGTLRVQYPAIHELDPAFAWNVHPAIWRATGDGLVALTQASGAAQLVPDLATAVPQPTDGGRTYAFRLRPGIRYSTGISVKASDLRRELERLYTAHSQAALNYSALQGAAACGKRPLACDLSRGVITDDRTGTIILYLTHPDPDLLFKLTLPAAWPVPPGTPRTHLATKPVPSTGPYRVGQFIPGRRLLLVRSERFREWSRAAQPDGYPDRIDIRMDDNPGHRVQAVLRGHADLALEIASVNLTPLRTRYASQLRLHAQPYTIFLSFNVRRAPFDNVLARRAVNLAIDRAAVARRLSGPGLSTPTCQVLPPHFPGHKAYCPWTRKPHDGRWHGPDIARARALVRASGTAGATVVFIRRNYDLTAAASAGALVSALRSIGYRPHVISGDAEFYRRLANPHGQWNISGGDWVADTPSPSEFLDRLLSCANYHPKDPARTTNGGGFCNARFDHLVRQAGAMQLTNPAAAQDIWARADHLAVDQAAWVPLVNTASAELLSRRAGHFTLAANSLPQIDQLWVR
jgi:DNA-binding SARP family transcriptional activator/ABC-type transport system substrate-binding protein/DNA-binding beta-propeller fold protein YncE